MRQNIIKHDDSWGGEALSPTCTIGFFSKRSPTIVVIGSESVVTRISFGVNKVLSYHSLPYFQSWRSVLSLLFISLTACRQVVIISEDEHRMQSKGMQDPWGICHPHRARTHIEEQVYHERSDESCSQLFAQCQFFGLPRKQPSKCALPQQLARCTRVKKSLKRSPRVHTFLCCSCVRVHVGSNRDAVPSDVTKTGIKIQRQHWLEMSRSMHLNWTLVSGQTLANQGSNMLFNP